MLDDKTKNQVKKLHSQWQGQANKSKALNKKFITVSGEEINALYTPLDLEGIDFERDINFSGAHPYTRGVHANMYRGKKKFMNHVEKIHEFSLRNSNSARQNI